MITQGRSGIDADIRRGVVIATAVTVPLVVGTALLLVALASNSAPVKQARASGPLPAVTVTAPPATTSTTAETCARVIAALPLRVAGQAVRATRSAQPSPNIMAWGQPPIVLRCGVAKPAKLTSALTDQLLEVNGVLLLPEARPGHHLFTVVDRAAYIDLQIPDNYRQPPLAPIADAVARATKPVCHAQPLPGEQQAPLETLCTRRR